MYLIPSTQIYVVSSKIPTAFINGLPTDQQIVTHPENIDKANDEIVAYLESVKARFANQEAIIYIKNGENELRESIPVRKVDALLGKIWRIALLKK